MRAQVSSEFMVVYSALLLIFIVVFTIYFGSNMNLFQVMDSVAAQRNAQAAAAAINYVYLAGSGASYNFSLANIGNGENLTVSGFAVTSERRLASASAPLIIGKVNESALSRGTIIITNNKGEIDIGK